MRMILTSPYWIVPDWPVPEGVGCLITTRQGGVSQGCYSSFNLGDHVGDSPEAVAANRSRLMRNIGAQPVWLNQVHGTRVLDAAEQQNEKMPAQADATYARDRGTASVVMTADCLPVLFCDDAGSVVAAAHAGWRGLCAGVLEETVRAMGVPGNRLLAYLGPAIGPQAFEVGDEVRSAFVVCSQEADKAFVPLASGKWLADIYQLARQRLSSQGVERIFGGDCCTFSEPERFFSYRRDGQTGRMASLIWRTAA